MSLLDDECDFMEFYSKIILCVNYQVLASLRSLSTLITCVMVLWDLRQEGSAKSPSLMVHISKSLKCQSCSCKLLVSCIGNTTFVEDSTLL